MERNYNLRKEISEIVNSLTSLPDYQDYQYDQELGFRKGPQSRGIELTDREATIGIKQPISRFAQRHLLLIEKDDKGMWKLKKTLMIYEG